MIPQRAGVEMRPGRRRAPRCSQRARETGIARSPSRNRASWRRAKSRSLSAVARCVIRPTTGARRPQLGDSQRPMPVSSSRAPAASGMRGAAATSSPASGAAATLAGGVEPRTMIRGSRSPCGARALLERRDAERSRRRRGPPGAVAGSVAVPVGPTTAQSSRLSARAAVRVAPQRAQVDRDLAGHPRSGERREIPALAGDGPPDPGQQVARDEADAGSTRCEATPWATAPTAPRGGARAFARNAAITPVSRSPCRRSRAGRP
jgi:hypothetical protein